MQLYLLRHADADTIAPSVDERFLSEKGMMQAQRVALFCERHAIRPSVVLTSPLRRAHQTAALVADKLGTEMRTVRWLSAGVMPETLLREVTEYRHLESCMLVGHEPDFSQFAAFLIGAAHGESIRIRKATLALFTILDFRPGGSRLEYSIPAKLL